MELLKTMASKSTSLIVRMPRSMKNQFEVTCQENDAIPSEVTRKLVDDYIQGKPTVRELLEENQARFNSILQKLEDTDQKNNG